MTNEDKLKHSPIFHYENGVPVFDPEGIDELAREQENAKERDRIYKDSQVFANRMMVIFTAVLAGCSMLAGGLTFWQASISNHTLKEIKKGAADTAKIIAAAQTQASTANKVADASAKSAKAAENFSASAVKINHQAELSVGEMKNIVGGIASSNAQAKKSLNAQIRPWIDLAIDNIHITNNAIDESGREFSVDAVTQNYGNYPATNVQWKFVQTLTDFFIGEGYYQSLCEGARGKDKEKDPNHNVSPISNTLFPGKAIPITDRVESVGMPLQGTTTVIGCVWYTGLDESVTYRTVVRYSAAAAQTKDQSLVKPRLAYSRTDEIESKQKP